MSSKSKLILPGGFSRPGHAQLVRNQATGRVLPCCWQDCTRNADNRFRVEVPHNQPRWKDELTGKQEMLVYTFCGDRHKLMFVKNTPYEKYA